jgi:hypothetical protein
VGSDFARRDPLPPWTAGPSVEPPTPTFEPAGDALPVAAPDLASELDPLPADELAHHAFAAFGHLAEDEEPSTDTAARGVASPGLSLPFADTIQARFGHHDISTIEAHDDPAAASASRQLGARAYAIGHDVAFAAPPDLHTAAHEAAHVIQQRGGVQLAGGIDQPGDPYERHADAVADAVVAGRSAESLLDLAPTGGVTSPAVQRAPQTAPATTTPEPAAAPPADGSSLARVRRVHELVQPLLSALLPAYRNAVDALDPIAAFELGQHCVDSYRVAEVACEHFDWTTVPEPARPEATNALAKLKHLLAALQLQLGAKLGPQMFRGAPVLGAITPRVPGVASSFLANEVNVTCSLLSVVQTIKASAGARGGSCPPLSLGQQTTIVNMVEAWRGRPVNFAFLRRVLFDEGIWQAVTETRGTVSGKTLDETGAVADRQAAELGALADLGSLDVETFDALSDNLPGSATTLFQSIAGAAPAARGVLLRRLQQAGKAHLLLGSVPWANVEQLEQSVYKFDPVAADMLRPYFVGQGGGRSLHRIYMDQADRHREALHAPGTPTLAKPDHFVSAFGWFMLDQAHNLVTAGFHHEYAAAYDALQQGLITDDEFHSAATKALGKAAVITAASAVTGGGAGAFVQGTARGLGRTAAQIIGGTAGGAASGVGGHLAGDIYDQVLNGKEGFDSLGDYAQSAITGAVSGAVMSSVSIGAGKYLPESAQRTADLYARRYPRMTRTLDVIQQAGARTAGELHAAGIQTATAIRVTVRELVDLIDSGFGGPGGPSALAVVGVGDFRMLPPDTELRVWIRPTRPLGEPMQMSGGDGPNAGQPGDRRNPVVIDKVDAQPAEGPRGRGATESVPTPEVGDAGLNPRPEIRVKKSDLRISTRKTKDEWTFSIETKLPNDTEVNIAYGTVLLDAAGNPVGGPEFYFEKRTVIGGVETRVQIYDGSKPLSLTDFALDSAIMRFKTEFGHPPDILPGDLAFDNKANFQRAYATALQNGLGDGEARQQAIRSVSFGRSRMRRGYDDFVVELGKFESLDLGPPLGVQRVPVSIHVEARRGNK